MTKVKGGTASFKDADGNKHSVNLCGLTGVIKVDGNSINVKFKRRSLSYLCTKSNTSLGNVNTLGKIPEFCKSYLSQSLKVA